MQFYLLVSFNVCTGIGFFDSTDLHDGGHKLQLILKSTM